MVTVKKLSMVIFGAVICGFCLGLEAVHPHGGYSHPEPNGEETGGDALLEKQQDFQLVLPYGVFLSLPPTVDRGNIVTGEYTGGQYEIADGFVPPQEGPSPHRHYSNYEGWYILEGSMAFQMGDQTFVATAGDFVYAPKGHLHAWQNLETTPGSVRLLLINTPPGLLEYIVQLGTQGTEEYYENLVTLAPKYDTEVVDSLFFNDSEYSVNEDGTLTAAVTVRRVGRSEEPASATIVLSDGTATLGEDYSNTEIPVNFAPQETTQTVNVPIPKLIGI